MANGVIGHKNLPRKAENQDAEEEFNTFIIVINVQLIEMSVHVIFLKCKSAAENRKPKGSERKKFL